MYHFHPVVNFFYEFTVELGYQTLHNTLPSVMVHDGILDQNPFLGIIQIPLMP